nr:tensin-4 [Pogona vitticeps]
MSKVIPNHVVRVGQTVCVSSQGENACLPHLNNGHLPCYTLPTQYLYYSMESWERESSLAQTKECSLPKMDLYEPCRSITDPRTSPNLEDKCLPQEPMEERKDTCPVSPTLDVSIEKLNRLMLEIDPTFQPLQVKPSQAQNLAVQTVPQSDTVAAQKHELDTSEIKYIEMSPARTKQEESFQRSTSPSNTPLSVSPRNHHLPPHGGIRGDHGHMTLMGGHDVGGSPRHLPAIKRQSPTCIHMSESISIPQRHQKNSAHYGSPSNLASSPGSENLLKLSQNGSRMEWRSETSVLSTSPGSDTSYILGSSTQSLSNNDPETPQTRSTGSPPSVGSFSGSFSGSCNSSSSSSPRGNNSLPQQCQKGQNDNFSPSSVANLPPIPIVLINGYPEESELSAIPFRVHPGSFKHKMHQPSSGTFSGVNRSNKTSSESSLSSSSSLDSYSKDNQNTMKFVMDTSKYWFKPSITRDQAIQLLSNEPPGSFIMRDSTSYRGSFGLAMKVFSNKTGENGGDHIKHFLIESSAKGVHLKGAGEEPYFGSLSAFVYQHTIMALALPCKLVIPSQDFIGGGETPTTSSETTLPLSPKAAVCNLLYLHSMAMETLTGKAAVLKAVSSTFEQEVLPTPTIVHFKVTEQGITLTDIQRKVFFRRHYPLTTISFCDMDPENRKWQKFSKTSRIFGVVAKSPSDAENVCHLFAEYDAVHPASHVVDFIKKLLPAT